MGGHGSGRRLHFGVKSTVESCRVLDVNWMIREGIFDGSGRRHGVIRWSNAVSGKSVSSLCYEMDLAEQWLRLEYRLSNTGQELNYRVPLTTTALPWGGERWWFICDLQCNGRCCKRRVGKLYLPRGAIYYGCRHCYDLTYQNCQDSRSRIAHGDKWMKEAGYTQFTDYELMQAFSGGLKSDRQYEKKIERNRQRRRRRKTLDWS